MNLDTEQRRGVEPDIPTLYISEEKNKKSYMSTDASTATNATAGSRKKRAKNSSSETNKVWKSRRTITTEEREDAYFQAEAKLIRR